MCLICLKTGQNQKFLLQSPIIALVGGNTCTTYSADKSVSNKFLYAASGFDRPTKEVQWELGGQRFNMFLCLVVVDNVSSFVATVIWECATFYNQDHNSGKWRFTGIVPVEKGNGYRSFQRL